MHPHLRSAVLLAITLGAAGAAGPAPVPTGFCPQRGEEEGRAEARFQELPSPAAFRTHLEALVRDPHPAGSQANARAAAYIAEVMEQAGLAVERCEYDVYLPTLEFRSQVALVTPVRLPLNDQEQVLPEDPFSAHADLTPGWNAFSGSGEVTAQVVYANYGRREDFEQLRALGVEVAGRIVVARYGGNYRGYKARYAEEAGAAGLVIYTDPADGGYTAGLVYPEGPNWNDSAVQRGSLLTLPYHGDPLTPGRPALPGEPGKLPDRLDLDQVSLPSIPVAPLPYGSATEILGRMRGQAVPSNWQGGLPFTYRLTGGPELTVRLRVEQPRGFVRIVDVVGTLEGAEMRDEWVIFGSHYDAWAFGATDPGSGTAALLTLAESLGRLAQEGQRPRRTIKIAHWDAEEYGIVGSVEWVEQWRDVLQRNGVAYVNADMAVCGPGFGGSASPSLKDLVVDVARVAQFADTAQTVFERWQPAPPADPPASVGDLGGGSDHVGFYVHLGVPSAYLTMGGPSLYHSAYDDLTYFARFCDPEFVYGPTIVRVYGLLALRLANADLIPYSVSRYAVGLRAHLEGLEKRAGELGDTLRLDSLRAAVARLDTAASAFVAVRDLAVGQGELPVGQLRRTNQGLIALERAFVRAEGLQDRPWCRSLYAAPDPYSGYAAWMLPGLRLEVEQRNLGGVAAWETIYVEAVDRLTAQVTDLAALLH